ncbi:MAG: GNAT family N-acetyltransferase [Candidatus Nanohalobium sp.]
MPGSKFLEGDKVNLRTIEEEDAEFLRDGVNHPEVRVWMGNTRPQNLEDEKGFIDEVVSSDSSINLMICREGYPKGIISLTDQEDEGKIGELGIWLHPEFHGNGFGTEAAWMLTDHAFKQLNYHKVYARAQKQNQPSIGVWEKLGFQKEGEFRDHTYAQGEYQDVVYLGMIQGDWE